MNPLHYFFLFNILLKWEIHHSQHRHLTQINKKILLIQSLRKQKSNKI